MENKQEWIKNYFNALKDVIDRFPVDDLITLVGVINEVRDSGRTLFICGNGGSWATAAHMVNDFSKNTRQSGMKRLRVVGLGDNIPLLTAYANDEGYDRVFAEPLMSLMKPDDVLLAISGSGNSPNVLLAIEAAHSISGKTFGLTGFSGGKMKQLVDHCLVIPSNSMEMIEDFHMIVDHIIATILTEEDNFSGWNH